MKLERGLVYVTAEEMRAIDRAAIESCKIDVVSLMENAGVATALLAVELFGGRAKGKRVACLAGKGNNGGDGLVASRHLHNWGAEVEVILGLGRDSAGDLEARQLAAVEAIGVRVVDANAGLGGYDLLIDALLGYNSKGPPREPLAGLIRRANSAGVSILAVDIPSGLDPTTGDPYEPCIAAKATLTLALPKTGFLNPASRGFVGELYLGDVSIPRKVYVDFQQAEPPFEGGRVTRLR